MIKKLLLYLRRRFLAYRLSLIQRDRNQHFECTLEHALQLAMVSDDVLCQEYSYRHGEKITVHVKAKRATDLTNWLWYVVERIEKGLYLEDHNLFPSYGKWRPTIDEFLVNDNGGSVTLLEYQVALRNGIVAFYDAVEACPDTSLQPYYLRRASAVIQDLYAVQEGMIYTSLIEL
jgi:hypothetical protein